MATKNEKLHGIIHTASTSAAVVGGGLAQLPGSDMPVLCGIQSTMIIAIANQCGKDISSTMAADLIVPFAAGYGGRAISQFLVG